MGVHCVAHWRERVKYILTKNEKYADLNKQNLQAYKVFECDVKNAWEGMEQANMAH